MVMDEYIQLSTGTLDNGATIANSPLVYVGGGVVSIGTDSVNK